MTLYHIKSSYTPNPCGSGFTHESGNTLCEFSKEMIPFVESLGFGVVYTLGNHPYINRLSKGDINLLLENGAEWG